MARLALILVMLLQSALWPVLTEPLKTKADKPATCCGETCCCGLPVGSGCPCTPNHERTPSPQAPVQKIDQAQSPARPQLARRIATLKPTRPDLDFCIKQTDSTARALEAQIDCSPLTRSMLCVWTV